MNRAILLRWSLAVAALFLLGAAGCSADSGTNPPVDGNGEFLTADPGDTAASGDDFSDGRGETGAPTAGEGDQNADESPEREIVEADVYNVVGSTLFVLNQYRGLVAIDLSNPSDLRILSRVAFRGTPYEMYVRDGRAYALLQSFSAWNFNDSNQGSGLLVVDVSNLAAMRVLGFHATPGQISDSRMVGDVIYLVSSGYYYNDGRPYDQTPDCAAVLDGTWQPPSQTGEADWGYRFRLYSVNVANPDAVREVDAVILGGQGQAVAVTTTHVFVADPNWGDSSQRPRLQVFDISDPAGEIRAVGAIETLGYVGDRWKIQGRGDHVFVVSQVWDWHNVGVRAGVYMESFSLAAETFGRRLDWLLLKANEQVHATRFDGDRAYVVTYQRTDPLFVLDIADPADIKVLGELVIPGWSTHIEPRGDRLLAVGRDDSDGWGSRVKVSLFDVSDPTRPGELSTVTIGAAGEYTWSEANEDWKAFKVWDDLGLITLPVMSWSSRWWTQVSRLYLVDFSREALAQRGYAESRGRVTRGVAHEGRIVSISDQEVQMIDIADRDNPAILSSLRLARYVDSILPCADTVCELGGGYYDQTLRLTQFDKDDPTMAVWESDPVENQASGYYYGWGSSRVRRAGDKLYVLNLRYGNYDENGNWVSDTSAVVNVFSAPLGQEPRFEFQAVLPPAPIPAELQNAQGNGYWWYSGWYRSDIAATASGALVLMTTIYGWRYPETVPGEVTTPRSEPEYYEKSMLLVYDLRNPAGVPEPVLVQDYLPPVHLERQGWFYYGYDFYDRPRLFPQGDTVLLPTCQDAGVDANGQPVARCYGLGLDLSNPAQPTRAYRVNVPGVLVNAVGDEWHTIAARWEREPGETGDQWSYAIAGDLYTLRREGDRVRVMERMPLTYRYESGNYYSWDYDLVGRGLPSPASQVRDYPLFDESTGVWMVREEQTWPTWVYFRLPVSGGEQYFACTHGTYEATQTITYHDARGNARATIPAGNESAWWQIQPVANGGVLMTRSCGGPRNYWGRYYGGWGMEDGMVGDVARPMARAVADECAAQGERWRYLAPTGQVREGFIPAGTYYNYYWGYYGNVSGTYTAARVGDALYLARGWEGILRVELGF